MRGLHCQVQYPDNKEYFPTVSLFDFSSTMFDIRDDWGNIITVSDVDCCAYNILRRNACLTFESAETRFSTKSQSSYPQCCNRVLFPCRPGHPSSANGERNCLGKTCVSFAASSSVTGHTTLVQ